MAPIFKTSLALLSVSAALLSSIDGVSAKKHNHNYGRHMKMAKRGSLFEDLSKRADELAPFGYDRCGVARSKPYVKKPSASPQPSSKWKPCPPGTPAYEAAVQAAQEDGGDDGDDGDDEDTSAVMTTSSYFDDGKNYKVEVVTSSASSAGSPTGAAAALGVDGDNSASATAAPVTTWVPETTSTSAPASSSSSSSAWSETPSSSSSSSSSSSWVEPSSSSSSSSSEWVEPSSSSSDDIPVASPGNKKVNLVKPQGGWANNPAPSSSSEAPAPAPTPEAPSTGVQDGQGMLGVSWDWLNPPGALQAWAGAKRVYTWSAFPPSDPLPAGMEWYPQYWGPGKQGDFEGQVARGIIKPGMTILGYNEPDQAGQANLGIQDGINSYLAQITPYADQGYRLATPGCTSDDNGFNWIKGFVDGCAGRCKFSVLQTHYYGTDADAFIAYIQNLYDTFGLPIIVSEYSAETFGNGPALSVGEVEAYVAKTQNWLKSQSFIESYFYFGPITSGQMGGVNLNNQMINDSGAINALGWQYLNTGK